jgi:hypothetical protein
MTISFIGNCQTLCLCYLFQHLLDKDKNDINWLLYGNHFFPYSVQEWTSKCNNKIIEEDQILNKIRTSDIIVYQEIDIEKSLFSNETFLKQESKKNSKLIKIPSVVFFYDNYENSINELKKREEINNVNIKVSDIFENHPNEKLMLTPWHPKSYILLEITKNICKIIGIKFFDNDEYNEFLQNINFMNLPD